MAINVVRALDHSLKFLEHLVSLSIFLMVKKNKLVFFLRNMECQDISIICCRIKISMKLRKVS